jgi:dTDP-4-dehydrorhamnose reductase
MNVLVTGASGLVGNAICRRFLNEKNHVIGVVNNSSAFIKHDNYKEASINLLTEVNKLDTYTIDLIIHCAAIIPTKKLTEDELFLKNQTIDQAIFSFCKKNKTKLIYFSTVFFYSSKGNNKLNESTPIIDNIKGYYLSKKNSEQYLMNSTIKSLIFRLSSPYGDITKQNNVMKFFIEKIKNNLPITLIEKGERRQNFIHIDDIAEACYLAVKKNLNGIFNLTFKKSYSMIELATFIKKYFKSGSTFLYDTTIKDIITNVNFDNSKLKFELNWEPHVDLNSGLIKTLNY